MNKGLTLLIPIFNEENSVVDTIESIRKVLTK